MFQTILFSTDENILENISKNDSSYCNLKSEPESPQDTKERPPTAIFSYEVCIDLNLFILLHFSLGSFR